MNHFLELISIYAWAIPAAAVTAPLLSLLGAHLATRDRSLQVMTVSQGAVLGTLLGLGFFHEAKLLPFASAVLLSGITYLGSEWLTRHSRASRATIFAGIFIFLLALCHAAGSLFPGLESHLAQAYFGDLATLTTRQAKLTLVLASLGLALYSAYHRRFLRNSFAIAIFGTPRFIVPARGEILFLLLTLFSLCLSIQSLGFLFTITMLFLPTALLSGSRSLGAGSHFRRISLLSSLGAALGFLLSLAVPRLPTVPAIALAVCSLGLFFLALARGKIPNGSKRCLAPIQGDIS